VTEGWYPIGEVARLAGVSVRTLHHYEAIGLVRPSSRTASGHRRYSPADLGRLRDVLVYRALGFPLERIGELLGATGPDVVQRLREQHRLTRERIAELERLLAALEKEMAERAMGMSLTPAEQFEIFGTDKVGGEWADEARERWGGTDAYQESARRTAGYTKQDWRRLAAEADAGWAAFRDAMHAGEPAGGERARRLAEEHRRYLSRWFYDCSRAMHATLAEMFVADDRFRATFDALADGLAGYVREAIVANAEALRG